MAVEALRVDLSEDLRLFSQSLFEKGIRHYISELHGEQVVWVESREYIPLVKEHYSRYLAGELPALVSRQPAPGRRRGRAIALPVTMVLILLSLFGAALAAINLELAAAFSFYRITPTDDGYILSAPAGEYWRYLTPIFLHFGLLHITFNALWVWELGRRIEFQLGGHWLLAMTALIGIGSNLAQVWYTPGQLFGGMSGVIYGYLGYIVVHQRLAPVPAFKLPVGVVVFMLAWLVLCMVGFTELMGIGAIANAAHLGGLLIGVALALIGHGWKRLRAAR